MFLMHNKMKHIQLQLKPTGWNAIIKILTYYYVHFFINLENNKI